MPSNGQTRPLVLKEFKVALKTSSSIAKNLLQSRGKNGYQAAALPRLPASEQRAAETEGEFKRSPNFRRRSKSSSGRSSSPIRASSPSSSRERHVTGLPGNAYSESIPGGNSFLPSRTTPLYFTSVLCLETSPGVLGDMAAALEPHFRVALAMMAVQRSSKSA
ncbi:hypothetical protein ACEPPN_008382 [Leptodophora sp. 'Broadleaf-Isolate-01']